MTRLRLVREEPGRMPWPLAAALILGALVWLFAIVGVRSLFGQVAPVVPIKDGRAETVVRNPSPDTLAVTVELLGPLPLLAPIHALVSPSAFRLLPGESQAVRLKLRTEVEAGTILRLRTCLEPVRARVVASSASGAVAHLSLRTCIVAKAPA